MKKLSKLIVLLFIIAAVTMCFVGCVKPKVVTFVVGDEEVITLTADKDGKVYEPIVDIPEGKYIVGWYTDVNRTVEFEFATDRIEANITLYVKLASYDFDVIYNLGYSEPEHGEEMPEAPIQSTVNLDDSFEVADAPTRVGYEFLGWTDGINIYQPGDTYEVDVAGNVTLTATWTTKMLKVRFYDDVGSLVETIYVPYGSDLVSDVNAPHTYPQCYDFIGWDKDLVNIKSDIDTNAIYEYVPADNSWFEFVPVMEDDEIIAYKLKMAPDEILPWQGKRFSPSGLYAFPDSYQEKPVIGFAEPIQSLGKNTFDEAVDIELYIPDSFTRLDEGSIFSSRIKDLYLGSGIEFIHNKAFDESFIENFVVSENNEHFSSDGDYLYNNDRTILVAVDRTLTHVEVIESVKYISANLMSSCDNLQSLVIKGDVEEIGLSAFNYCQYLTTVIIEGSVKKLPDGDDVAVTGDLFPQNFPSFAFCRRLTSIDLKGIEYIGFGCFTDCYSLTSITLDTTLEYVAEEAFVNLESLATLKFPGTSTVSNNGKYICEGNTLIEKEASDIMIDDTTHGDIFIYYAPKQERVHYDVPLTVREFREYAFELAEIETISIPEGIKELPCGLFERSTLTEIEIPQSVEVLGTGDTSRGAFATDISTVFGRSELTSVTFAQNCQITVIPQSTFHSTLLTTIEIPASIEEIGDDAFACETMMSITVADGNSFFEADEGILYTAGATEILYYPAAKMGSLYQSPETLEKVRVGAFKDNKNLERVELNEGLTDILPFAFLRSNLKEIVFPSTIVNIDVTAFEISPYFTFIEFKAAQPCNVTDLEEQNISEIFIILNINKLKILVPFASYDAYYEWLDEYSQDCEDCIDVSQFPDEYVTKYVFISQGVSETVKAITLLEYPIPTWTGEGTMYFNGWFKDEGTWTQEISLPCQYDLNTTHTYYARWETTQRKDGSDVLFAYELPIGEEVTVTLHSNVVYFKENINPNTDNYETLFLRLYVIGLDIEFRIDAIYKNNMPADFIKYLKVDFTGIFDEFPAQATLKFVILLS